jgi:hypothetical protein
MGDGRRVLGRGLNQSNPAEAQPSRLPAGSIVRFGHICQQIGSPTGTVLERHIGEKEP